MNSEGKFFDDPLIRRASIKKIRSIIYELPKQGKGGEEKILLSGVTERLARSVDP